MSDVTVTTAAACEGLRSGQVAAAAGVNIETLRYYERRGLLAEPDRSPGGHRLYDADTVTTLRVIKAAQRLGFTLEEVADLLDVGRRSHAGRHRRRVRDADTGLQQRARAKLTEVEERIADLLTIRDTLRASDLPPRPIVCPSPRPATAQASTISGRPSAAGAIKPHPGCSVLPDSIYQ